MAVPHVSGVAAMLWSHFSTLNATEIRHVLELTATDLGMTGRDDKYGHGLVNAKAAYDLLRNGVTSRPSTSPTDHGVRSSPSTSPTDRGVTFSPSTSPTDRAITFSPSTSPTDQAITFNPSISPTDRDITFSPSISPTDQAITFSPSTSPTGHGVTFSPSTFPTDRGINFSPSSFPTSHSVTFRPSTSPTIFDCENDWKIFYLSIVPDDYPEELSWKLQKACTNEIVLEGNEFGTFACVEHQLYQFSMYDKFGDGITAPGKYIVFYDDNLVHIGGGFDYEESFMFGDNDATCSPSIASLPPSTIPSLSPTQKPSPVPLESISTIISLGFHNVSFTMNPFNGVTDLFEHKSEDYLMSTLSNKTEKKVLFHNISVELMSQYIFKRIDEGINLHYRYLNENEGLLVILNVTAQVIKTAPGNNTKDAIDQILGVFQNTFPEYRSFILDDYRTWKDVIKRNDEHIEEYINEKGKSSITFEGPFLYLFVAIFGLVVIFGFIYFVLLRKIQQARKSTNDDVIANQTKVKINRRGADSAAGRKGSAKEEGNKEVSDMNPISGTGVSDEELCIQRIQGMLKYKKMIQEEENFEVNPSSSHHNCYDLDNCTTNKQNLNPRSTCKEIDDTHPNHNESDLKRGDPESSVGGIEHESDLSDGSSESDSSVHYFHI